LLSAASFISIRYNIVKTLGGKLATKIYETVELELLDGRVITIKPLSIKNLRSLMKEWEKSRESKTEIEFLDVVSECARIAFRQFAPDLADDPEAFEDAIDLQTMYKVLEVAADIKLNDPNLQAAATELLGQI